MLDPLRIPCQEGRAHVRGEYQKNLFCEDWKLGTLCVSYSSHYLLQYPTQGGLAPGGDACKSAISPFRVCMESLTSASVISFCTRFVQGPRVSSLPRILACGGIDVQEMLLAINFDLSANRVFAKRFPVVLK